MVCIDLYHPTESSNVEEHVHVDKFEKEDEMLERYQTHMQFLVKLKELAASGENYSAFLELPEASANRKVLLFAR